MTKALKEVRVGELVLTTGDRGSSLFGALARRGRWAQSGRLIGSSKEETLREFLSRQSGWTHKEESTRSGRTVYLLWADNSGVAVPREVYEASTLPEGTLW